ncbi:MAG: hypothetical protein ACOYMH_14325, partial [Zwartia sp.]
MSEQDPERKTITLKTRALKPRSIAGGDQTRARLGARARQVAQLKIAKEKSSRLQTASIEKKLAERPAKPTAQETPTRPNRGSVPREPSPRPTAAPKALPLREEAQIERASSLVLDTEIFHIFAPCPTGLEEALAAELGALGYAQVQPTRA